ncbi:MAG: glucosaminidase domain-containing protein [Deferrisomatales bacterium]|nr:glucosaminidase domain-containing protein [Deferrisomatales bacterium]
MSPSVHRPLSLRLAALLGPFLPAALVCLGVLLTQGALQLPFVTPLETPLAEERPSLPHRVRHLSADTAQELLNRLDQVWDAAGDGVPGLAPSRFPADLDQLPVADRKVVFFRSLLPHVLAHNNRITGERARLVGVSERAANGVGLGETDRRFLGNLADRYRLGLEVTEPAAQLEVLLRRVDVVPPSIALAQAAIESAWGTSRFALLGNNLFGQWVFDRERGMAPLERPDDANYSLARFQGLGDAVAAYLGNLNGFSAYREFRQMRRQMRATEASLDPYRLAEGLSNYSIRRDEYVREVRSVIRSNDLTRYDRARLAVPGTASLL